MKYLYRPCHSYCSFRCDPLHLFRLCLVEFHRMRIPFVMLAIYPFVLFLFIFIMLIVSLLFSFLLFLHFNLWLLFYFLTLDPVIDNVDENLMNLAYSDQNIDDDGDDEIMRIENRRCCKGIFTGSQQYEDQIRERSYTHTHILQLWLMSFPIN